MPELENERVTFLIVPAILHEITVLVSEVAFPMDGDPIKWHAVTSTFAVEVMPLHHDVLHRLMLVMSSPVLVVK
jgi:hypothetical protein